MQGKRLLVVALLVTGLPLALWWLTPGNTDEAIWEDYLERLARLTRQDVPDRAPLPIKPYPGTRELREALPEHRVDLLDYLELRHCDLMELISQRNSALGKLQADSLRLNHELAFIRRARSCLEAQTLEDPVLSATLATVVTEKSAALPALYWNVLVASEETRHFFSQSPSQQGGDISAGLGSLQRLAHTLSRHREHHALAPLDLEPLLETLIHNPGGGKVLRRMALALRELERGNQLLAGIDPQRLCPKDRASTRARRLRNVLDNVWGPRVQATLTDNRRRYRQLMETLRLMNGMQVSDQAVFRDWRRHYFGPAGVEKQLEQALARHVRLWQSRLRPCGLMPDGHP